MSCDLSLANKYAVICGSTQGIGLATAIALASLGANCILLARNKLALAEAVKKLTTADGQKHSYAVADFSNADSVRLAITEIAATTRIEILINNSGGPKPGPLSEAGTSEFEQAFNQHLICNQILSTTVLPAMKSARYGRIINIISTSVKTPLPNLGVSNTIRAAVASWAKTLANEVGPHNITVNNVLPGFTKTARYDSLVRDTATAKSSSTETVENEFTASIPLRRIGEASEVANVIAFLASPAASYVSGVSIPVDGGRTPSI